MAKKIMIIDDQATARHRVRQAASTSLDTVLEFATSEEAIRVMDTFQPDCVMLGISCPAPDALQAIRSIRKKSPEARVVAVSNYNEMEFRQAASDAGASGYVTTQDLSELFLLAAPERVEHSPIPRAANGGPKKKK